MAKASHWSKSQVNCFIRVLEETGNVSAAARSAKVSRQSAYEKRKNDTDFSLAWSSAMEVSLDDLEEGLRRRALEGIEKPVYYAGKRIGDVKSYNDNLGMFLLKARRKEVYGESSDNDQEGAVISTASLKDKLLSKLEEIKNNSN